MTQRLAVGIDIGGTNTSYGIIDREGNILAKGKMSTTEYADVNAYVEGLASKVRPLIDSAGIENMVGVGVGAPNGNFYTGEIAFAPNLPWKGVIPMSKLIGDALGLNCTLTNDANAAAIGEMKYGVAKGMNDFVMVTLGTGVGGGFVSNGKLIYGHDGFAGELGHITAIRDGRTCGCGRKGCVEIYCSATGIVITAEEWLAERRDETSLREHTGKITARLIHEAADAGDPFALELFAFTGRILGLTLADIMAICSPEAFVFFGGLARAGNILLSHVHKHMEENMLRIYQGKVKLLQSALPDADAAILGASALAW
ncbi:MAG: ROK family protein [Taibaiella sp.]|nr:ROK family protein [Taibaiella sp.]